MSPVNLHPETLLDKLGSEELSEAEQRTLDEHVQQCLTCRFELQVRADLHSELLQLHLVDGGGPSNVGALEQYHSQLRPRPTTRRRSRYTVLLSVAALVSASGAAALMSVGAFAPQPAAHSPPPKAAASAQAQAASIKPGRRELLESEKPAAASDSQAPSPKPETLVQKPRAKTPRPNAKPQAKQSSRAAAAPAAPRSDAAELFRAANQARRASRLPEAKHLYRQLQEQFPSSSEAELSLVTLASLHLDTGNAAGALRMFDNYLQRAGRPLAAEALYGRARALRRLNQSQAEARAWRGLLAKYPGSRYAQEAHERLKALSVQ